ncbi:hypothetical protein [Haloterrigena alkaliphila]|uniref:Uncharacterized protein n=1 Tax=Haloterrigena alkaliphila TaxID=2816475 RepID=A0A8A2VDX7_9EURY|nr:hypothetical protein [Haloterrigena alkaliphila]QSW98582.1 hypothetical protein J0X25_14450 [Haloterrigena alkaliphila]
MRPVDLYGVGGPGGLEPNAPLAITGIGLETYQALSQLERAGLQFAAVLLAGTVVLGLLQRYGPGTVTKARRSPVISICIGLPSLFVLGGLVSTGVLITGTSFGTFFGIPLVVLGGTALSTLTVLGLVATGRSIAARLGCDRLWTGVLVASLLAGVAGLSLAASLVVFSLAGALGVGAGVRVIMATGGASNPDERTVPPANKI